MLTDKFLDCAETPVWFPNTYNYSELIPCNSCTVRLNAPISGPGLVSPHVLGLIVDENPTATLTINGIQHNLQEAILMFPAAHRLSDEREPSPAELIVLFQNSQIPGKYAALCIILEIGSGPSTKYFSTLGTQVSSNRPTLNSVIPNVSELIN